jgi:hypothetical protein
LPRSAIATCSVVVPILIRIDELSGIREAALTPIRRFSSVASLRLAS